jgi:MFS family permease
MTERLPHLSPFRSSCDTCHSTRRVSVRIPTVPETAAKRYSERASSVVYHGNEESLEKWRQKTLNWNFGVDPDLQLRHSTSSDQPQDRSEKHLTVWEYPSDEDVSSSSQGGKNCGYSQNLWAFSDDVLPSVPVVRAQGDDGGNRDSGPKTEIYPALALPLWREIFFIIVICLAMFTTQVGLGQVLLLLASIGRTFETHDPGELIWLVAGYSLTVGTFILVSGRLGDVYGYKRLLVIGYIWFAVWNMVAGLAIYDKKNGYIMFVFARVLSGIGPAITMPNALAIFGSAYPDGTRKSMAFALFGASAPSGCIVGGAFAALFDLTWWPWTFFSFAVFLMILALLCAVCIPSIPATRSTPKTWKDVCRDLDLFGGITGVTSLILINFAWNQAIVVGWSRGVDYVYICLVIGMVLLPTFLVIETKFATEPLIPFSALTGDVAFVMGCIACGWACFGIWFFFLLQIYTKLRHGSPLLVAAWFSPVAVSGFAAAVFTGFILTKTRTTVVMVMSMSSFLIGAILAATVPVHQTYWAQTFVCGFVMPWGMIMSFTAGAAITSASDLKEHQGVAASLISTVVNYSISVGLGFAGTVELQVDHGGENEEGMLRGYRGAMYLAVGLAGLGLVLSLVFVVRQAHNEPRKKKRRLVTFPLPEKTLELNGSRYN